MHACIRKYIHIHIYVHMLPDICTQITCVYMHTYTHTCITSYIYIHTHDSFVGEKHKELVKTCLCT